jgi:hypothetical protein
MRRFMTFSRRLHAFYLILFVAVAITLFWILIIKKDKTPRLLPGIYIQEGSKDLNAGYWTVPVVYDWDSDGRIDLLVGQRYDDGRVKHGYISFFKNTGIGNDHYFKGSSWLKIRGECCLDVQADG